MTFGMHRHVELYLLMSPVNASKGNTSASLQSPKLYWLSNSPAGLTQETFDCLGPNCRSLIPPSAIAETQREYSEEKPFLFVWPLLLLVIQCSKAIGFRNISFGRESNCLKSLLKVDDPEMIHILETGNTVFMSGNRIQTEKYSSNNSNSAQGLLL